MKKLLMIATILTAANAFAAGKDGSDSLESPKLSSDAGAGNRDGGSAGSGNEYGNDKLFGNDN